MIPCLGIKDLKGSLNHRGFEMQWNLNKWELIQQAKAQTVYATGASQTAKEASGDGGNVCHLHQPNGPWQDPLCKVGDTAHYENALNHTKL